MRDLVGETLSGRYRLVARLAGGGMGEVYRGHDLLLDRAVAVKILSPSLSNDPELVARFRAEARAAARLTHPNIVAVYDWGSEDENTYYMVMEYVAGTDARDLLVTRLALEPGHAAAIVACVCDALDAAHGAGLVHRDVKPENILIARSGAVKVADFGIAVVVDAERTLPGTNISGTLRYLSPEQAQGEPATFASDIWATGAVLSELLTGIPPLQGAGPDLLRRRAVEPPTPPSKLDPSVPSELDEIVVTACAVDPDARFTDPASMGHALRSAARSWLATPEEMQELLADVTGEIHLPDMEPTTFASSRRLRPRRRHLILKMLVAPLVAAMVAFGGLAAARTFFGPRRVPVPVLFGLTRAEARALANDAGIDVVVAGRVSDLSVPKGAVAHQSPERGRVEEGDAVKMWLSSGPPIAPIPDVVGMRAPKAAVALRAAGMEVGDTRRRYSFEPEGAVIGQRPANAAAYGTVVRLIVSKGPRPVQVPDVSEMDVDEAKSMLKGESLVVVVTKVYSDEVKNGLVIGTNPAAGATAPARSEIELFVSLGPEFKKLKMPDVRNMSVAAARARLQDLGLRVKVIGTCKGGSTVVETDPIAGTTVRENDLVALFVC
jgi:serine/threonine-protein kinase